MDTQPPSAKLDALFVAYSRLGNASSDGNSITLEQANAWLERANLAGPSMIETAAVFGRHQKPTITFDAFMRFIDELAATRQITADDMRRNLMQVSIPSEEQSRPTEVSNTLVTAQDERHRSSCTTGEAMIGANITPVSNPHKSCGKNKQQ